jgi:hypothetical protein
MSHPPLFGLETLIPVTGNTVSVQQAPYPNTDLYRLYVTVHIRPSTSRQFDYYMIAGNAGTLSFQIASRAVAQAVLFGADGIFLTEQNWDNVVVVQYAGRTFRGHDQILSIDLHRDSSLYNA